MADEDAIEALQRRIAALEKRQGATDPVPRSRCHRCAAVVPSGRFCSACGALLAAAPAPESPPLPPSNATVIGSHRPLPPPPQPQAPVPAASPPPASRTPASVENMLGERWAPRIGAALVFLGVIFFLGLAIQRGWVGPIAQLMIAALAGGALIGIGAWLTSKRGYGTYPQVLEATGACVLYVTAFVAHALPYYARATGLTELGSGILMATVAAGTIGLALWRDARVIAALGYGLAFITALLGLESLPDITLPYVAILGTSLALVAARKAWTQEGLVGSFATGGLLLWLAYGSGTDATAVAIVALAPAAAFLWLASRPARLDAHSDATAGLLVFVTFGWTSVVSIAATDGATAIGILLFTWALVALGLTVVAVRAAGHPSAIAIAGVSAILFWIVAAPFAWSAWVETQLLVTATYALGALALGGYATLSGHAPSKGVWNAALALIGAAALHAIAWPGLMRAPWEASTAIGPWQAWIVLALVAAPLAIASTTRDAPSTARRAAFWIAATFGALWTFALFGAALPSTLWLLLVVGALVAIALRASEDDGGLEKSALAASFAVLGLVVFKILFFDTSISGARVDATSAALQSLLVAGAMLALHQVGTRRGLVRADIDRFASGALVGGSAFVLVTWVISYATDSWTSVLIGAIGVAYLAAGLVQKTLVIHRYTGFAVLGFVILRVFTVELQGTDLAVRAIVFVVLGAALLGIGYAYARMQRREAASVEPVEEDRT